MRWLVTLVTDNDPIPLCRLMNTFRRKGIKLVALAAAAQPGGFSLLAVMESPAPDVEHVFNFLRGVGGVRHVTCYRQEPSAEASFLFVDAEAGASLAQFLQICPEAKLAFASHGKYLYEVPAGGAARWASLAQPEFLPLAQVKSSAPQRELVGAFTNEER